MHFAYKLSQFSQRHGGRVLPLEGRCVERAHTEAFALTAAHLDKLEEEVPPRKSAGLLGGRRRRGGDADGLVLVLLSVSMSLLARIPRELLLWLTWFFGGLWNILW